MEGTSKQSKDPTLEKSQNDDEEGEVDLSELDIVENLLLKDSSDELKFLEFERQMFLDCVYNDGLVICAKGISFEKVLLNLFNVYLGAAHLVLVLNSDDNEEKYYTKLLNSPHVHQASSNSNEREKVYLSGGLQFISTQVLVLDLLKNKIPTQLITGIFVLRAHKIIESCQEAFALRLYRQKNKTGFIKAFTSSAEAFTMGYGHVEKVMRNLFVRDLFLWPRFHALIQKDLKAYEPTSIEFHIPLSSKMTLIQTHILDLMNFIVKELKRINPNVDLEEVTVENCMTKKFQKILQCQLDLIWDQLNAKTKLLITDLKVLRGLMFSAMYGDSVTFYTHLKKYRSANYAMNNSGWTLLNAAEQIFKLSKERVFNSKDEFEPEPCPKWKALSEILRSEIPADIKNMIKDERYEFDKSKAVKILVLCSDARTCYQLNQYLTQGVERTLFWTAMRNDVPVQKLSNKYKFLSGGGSGIVKDAVNVQKVDLHPDKPSTSKAIEQKTEKIPLKLSEEKTRKRKAELSKSETKDDAKEAKEDTAELDVEEENEFIKDTYLLTMSQKIGGNESFLAADFDLTQSENVEFEICDELNEELNATSVASMMQQPSVYIQTFRSDQNRNSTLEQKLHEMCPDYVVLYNVNMAAIRLIEIFEARLRRHPKRRLKVFVLMHAKTVEEQSFLTGLRREKKAFEYLIDTKSKMVVPEYQDGKSDLDLSSNQPPEEEEEEVDTRQAGGQKSAVKKEKPRIVVDSREFRSELPCLIHRRGIDVVPAMISIGDYIITPEICVERKSISDLIGSLNNGRLYNQCQQMLRYYPKAILLIEFDQNRPFHLQGRYMLSRDTESSNIDIMQKLQLLTIHFPKLRLVWSPSPYATAQLFEELKQNKEEPTVEAAMQVGSDDPLQDLATATDKYNTSVYDFLLKLPGIHIKNIHTVMRTGKNLQHLVTLSEVELVEVVGNARDAKLLHDALHNVIKPTKQEEKPSKKKFFKRN